MYAAAGFVRHKEDEARMANSTMSDTSSPTVVLYARASLMHTALWCTSSKVVKSAVQRSSTQEELQSDPDAAVSRLNDRFAAVDVLWLRQQGKRPNAHLKPSVRSSSAVLSVECRFQDLPSTHQADSSDLRPPLLARRRADVKVCVLKRSM